MISKEWYKHAKEIVDSCQAVMFMTQELEYDTFIVNSEDAQDTRLVISQYLQKIGTAAYDLPQVIFDLYPRIDWRGLVAMGFALEASEDLCSVTNRVLWSVVQDTLPELLTILQNLLKESKQKTKNIYGH